MCIFFLSRTNNIILKCWHVWTALLTFFQLYTAIFHTSAHGCEFFIVGTAKEKNGHLNNLPFWMYLQNRVYCYL